MLRAQKPVEYTIDSLMHSLTIEEKISQLIYSADNLPEKNISTGLALDNVDIRVAAKMHNHLLDSAGIPMMHCAFDQHVDSSMISGLPTLVDDDIFYYVRDEQLIADYYAVYAKVLRQMNIGLYHYTPFGLTINQKGPEWKMNFYGNNREPSTLLKQIKSGMNQQGVQLSIALDIDLPTDFQGWKELKDTYRDTLTNNYAEYEADEQQIFLLHKLPVSGHESAAYFYKKFTKPFLQNQLGIEGILMADMRSICDHNKTLLNMPEGYREVSALIAGADMVITNQVQKTHDAILQAVEDGYIRKHDFNDKVRKALKLKYERGLNGLRHISPHHPVPSYLQADLAVIQQKIVESSTVLLKNDNNILPIQNLRNQYFASVSIGSESLSPFQEILDEYALFTHYILREEDINEYHLSTLAKKLDTYDHVIIGLHTAIDPKLLSKIFSSTKAHVIVVDMATSYTSNLPGEAIIYTPRADVEYQRTAAQAIFGAVPVKGVMAWWYEDNMPRGLNAVPVDRLHYDVPENAGMSSTMLRQIDSIVMESIKMHATPGCQILVAKDGKLVYHKSFGYYTYDSIMPVSNRSVYDLASVTKVIATTPAIMKLYEQGKINLNSSLGSYLPTTIGTNKQDLSIADVMTHQSGLRAFIPYWKRTLSSDYDSINYYHDEQDENYNKEVSPGLYASHNVADSLWQWTLDSELRKKRRSRRYVPYDYRYSDLGFFIMQKVAEMQSAMPLEEYVQSEFYDGLGMASTQFNPTCNLPLSRLVPTEVDNDFRNALIWGTVHDQMAAMNGGVAGHAGLFGNAIDLAKFGQMLLNGGTYGGEKYFDEATIQLFTSRQFPKNRRGLGWDKPDIKDADNLVGRYVSELTFGHTGFTGTAFWVDPAFNLVYIFLSNRIHPTAAVTKLIEHNIRQRIFDVVYESIWEYEKYY